MKSRLEDPVLRSSRREALVCFGIWVAACVYTVGYCGAFGYNLDPKTLTFVAGIPSWVFYGILVPWTVCTLTSFVVSSFFIADDDLGEEEQEEDLSSAAVAARRQLAAEQGGADDA